MKWVIVTSDASQHIIGAQRYLFGKYAPRQKLNYVSTGKAGLDRWCFSVLVQIAEIRDEYIMFGLDDYLPIAPLKEITEPDVDFFNRLAIGWGCSKSKETLDAGAHHILYTDRTPYQVSCQFSMWRTEALRKVLNAINGSPWDFEIHGRIDRVYALKEPAFRWIEESAISRRQPGKINLAGMRRDDICDLMEKRLIDPVSVIYGWKGDYHYTEEAYGTKYAEFYK